MWTFPEQKREANQALLFDEKWKDIQLTESSSFGLYNLILSNSKERFSTVVTPVLSGQDLKEFSKELKNHQKLFSSRKNRLAAQDQRNKSLGRVIRNARISSFGPYNWDKMMRIIESETVYSKPLLAIDDERIEDFYMIYGGLDQTVIHYTPNTVDQFFYFTKLPSAILVVKEGDIYGIRNKELKRYFNKKRASNLVPQYISSLPHSTAKLDQKLIELQVLLNK